MESNIKLTECIVCIRSRVYKYIFLSNCVGVMTVLFPCHVVVLLVGRQCSFVTCILYCR